MHLQTMTLHTTATLASDLDQTTKEEQENSDGAWIDVKPGDHIVFSAWMKTSGASSDYGGERMGIDYYGSIFVNGAYVDYAIPSNANGQADGHPNDADNTYPGTGSVAWGTDWTLKTWDIYVPTTVYHYYRIWDGHEIVVAPCDPVQISGIVPIFDAQNETNSAFVWFADPQLYIIP